MKWRSAVLLTVVLAVLSGCGSSPRMQEGEIETETVEETRGGREIGAALETTDGEKRKAEEKAKVQEISARESSEETAAAGKDQGKRAEYVGIRGHIKEVKGDAALISSDTDQFPGVFWVTGLRELAAEEELKGGTSVFVLMEDTGEEEADGLRRFAGKELVALSHEEERAQVDVLLTSPPPLTLTDALSSRYEPFEVQPGNYKWGELDESGEAKEIVACGSAPLDERMLKDRTKLKLPVYNKMDKVFYTFSTVIDPDRLVIRQWKASDAGHMEAEEESITILYYVIPIAGLEKDKIYEFTAEWDKENFEKHGFWGNASYALTTE